MEYEKNGGGRSLKQPGKKERTESDVVLFFLSCISFVAETQWHLVQNDIF